MIKNLTTIISQLQSEKFKERQSGLALIEEAFAASDKLAKSLALAGNSKEWSTLLRALFTSVATEKAACSRKGYANATSVALGRLETAGLAVRNVTEYSVAYMSWKVARLLLDHLCDAMVHRGQLLPSLSTNYIKAILAICTHQPHLEHLEEERWISLVSLAFAAILGDSLQGSRGFAAEDSDHVSDSEMDVDQDLANDVAAPRLGKRRRRHEPSVQPGSFDSANEPPRTVSFEQIDFMRLLAVLLRSPYAPYMSPGISQRILNRLRRFFVDFSAWSGAHFHALVALNIVLSQVALNARDIVTYFGLKVWAPLLFHWKQKDRSVKEELVVAMTTLFPFITRTEIAEAPRSHVRELVDKLYACLEDDFAQATSEGLTFDCLRFRIRDADEDQNVFEARTFRFGFHFGPSQALSWATMELHADCAQVLHLYSESIGSPVKKRRMVAGTSRRKEEPLANILTYSAKDAFPSKVRSNYLQLLLFTIDRHWAILHDALQQEISSTLLDLLAKDDPVVQSWIFLCLAAIASAEGTANEEAIDWNSIWNHSVRRTNVLNVCRAACHAAHALLASQRLPMHLVLADIEAFARDLVVQGPTSPFDSVCAFLCDCLRIASQDVRLHRIQLPDKVLSWLSENWSISGHDLRFTKPVHIIADVLTLLEVTCGLAKSSQLLVRHLLPECVVVDAAIERHKTSALRAFILQTRLPPFRPPRVPPTHHRNFEHTAIDATRHSAPSPREIKVSALLLKSLDLLYVAWETTKDPILEAGPEKVRRALDAIVIALCFEASLVRNGIQSNRRVIQAACRLVEFVTPCLELSRWKPGERALILMGLEPLTSNSEPQLEDDPWDVMPGPLEGSGIKRSLLVSLSKNMDKNPSSSVSARRALQVVLWQRADVQDAFENVLKALRNTLRIVAGPFQHAARITEDEEDADFAVRVADSGSPDTRVYELRPSNQICIQICITFLAISPILQSGSLDATRDKHLTDFIIGCDLSAFIALAPEFLRAVRNKTLHLSAASAEQLLSPLDTLLSKSYNFTRSVAATTLAIQFLHSTSHLWTQPTISDGLRDGVRLMNKWLSGLSAEKKLGSWRVRDRFICYLDHYVAIDPQETFWVGSGDALENDESVQPETTLPPSTLLPRMADDPDIRVRFRAANANGRLFSTSNITNRDPMQTYERMRNELSLDADNWEHMLTRFLHLGNAMVASSAVRRGSYWHILEICLFCSEPSSSCPDYTAAIESVLSAVAERLGLPDLRSLFEAYASQLVTSVMLSEKKFFSFPPSLLGYTDRRQCASATFPLLAPIILEAGGDSPKVSQAVQRVFEEHCQQAQKSVSQGLFECFADVVGTRIVHQIDLQIDSEERLNPEILQVLISQIHQLAMATGDTSTLEPDSIVLQSLDRIVYAILRTVKDDDHSREGTIVQALKRHARSDRDVPTFLALTIYQKPEDFKMHHPNMPVFSAVTILQSLTWLSKHASEVFTKPIIYHVLHSVLADISRSSLVNEQMRLLHALCMWISINASSFKDRTLLRTLIRGAINFLSQSDLAHLAQGILGWAFGHYTSLKSLESTFPDLLVRIARIAHDYSRDIDDPVLSSLGNELLVWIEKQASTLSAVDSIKAQIASALPLWPRQPTGPLAELADELQSQPLSGILQDRHITSGKFRLVRRLRDMADHNRYTQDEFCHRDFWHLKSCIPPQKQMQDEDIDAFMDILFRNAARINPLSVELVSSKSAALLHREASINPVDKGFIAVPPRRSIILSLFNLLAADVASQTHRAYTTLRLLFASSSSELKDIHDWPSSCREEILYLSLYPLPAATKPTRLLDELQASGLALTEEFPPWICEVASLLNDILADTDLFYAQLSSLTRSDPSFAAQLLPVLVHSVLLTDQGDARKQLSQYFSSILLDDTAPRQCRHSIVDVVLHLRNFVPPDVTNDPLAYDKWLDIDFRLLSRGAMSCGAYTTALLFLELAADYSQDSLSAETTTEEILYHIYSHIEEPDGFYAIKSNDVRGFLTRRFHHEGQWDKAFQFHGADFAAGLRGSQGAEGIYQSLHSNGLDNLAMAVHQSANPETAGPAESSQIGYQLAWRTEMWDLPEPQGDRRADSSLYTALRAIHRGRDERATDSLLSGALRQEMSRLHATGNEDMIGIRARVQTLLCLGEVKRWRAKSLQTRLEAQDVTLANWAHFVDISSQFDFTTLESVMATRMSLLRSTKHREQRQQIGDLESPFVSGLKRLQQKCLIRLSEAARLSEHHQIALNATVHAQRLERIPTFEVSQEFASVLWLQKEHKPAVEYLKGLVAGRPAQTTAEEAAKLALILSRLGTWSAEACLQKPAEIREQFFDRATALILGSESQAGDHSTDPELAVIFHQYALFAEEQYQVILRSPEISRLKVYAERKKQEIEHLKDSLQGMSDKAPQFNQLSQQQRKAETQYGEDKAQIYVHAESRSSFLLQAIEMYSRCLQASNDFDDSAVIRLCSLWFANFNESLQIDFSRALSRVPSRKLVFLAHQLSARLARANTDDMSSLSDNQKTLRNLILRMCNEHPFHSLYQVWALQQSAPQSSPRGSLGGSTGNESHTGRATAAADIFAMCRQYAPNTFRVQAIEELCGAYLEWAKYPLKDNPTFKQLAKKTDLKVPRIRLRRISDLPVPVTTSHTPLDPSLRYDNIVTIVKYSEQYSTAGGLNLPKISTCLGSDGRRYKQLFKGEGGDDMRQDAVMEQVFELVNVVLLRDRHTRKRQLSVRCYKVIPLAPQAGLLEYVENTTPLKTWLVPAHERYRRPGDVTNNYCVRTIHNYRVERNGIIEDPADLRKTFLKILRRFPPVFRHFFTDRHKLPMEWFSTRLNYARSVATTSIVGHVLGLGDRHPSNILIDLTTGEVVHIDLGIAFEQGKRLTIPETVPFRLTGDMVDGLGTAGTEGVFRRCAEETLRVLRAESGVVTTVLEVFRHDPLHSWTANAIKINRVQAPSEGHLAHDMTMFGIGIDLASDSAEESADRALASVHRKLDKSLSVEYTVNELIVSATDSMNLSQLFVGWNAWL